MKNLFSVLLIVTLAVASSVSAQAVPQADVEDSMLQEALWNKMKKNHHHHEKNDGDCQKKHFSFSPFVTPYLGVGGICKAACDGKKLACEKTCDTEDHDCEKDCLFKDDKCEKGCRFRGQDCKDRCRFRRGDRLDDRFPLEHEDGFPFEHEDGFPLEHEPFPEFDNLENTAPPA
ncbi:hypothetical protein BGZ99_007293 [Dissophora globulifera]|uniref:Uncharacterized protein n=1 Tax=Dissophora globulifera TaxID=979702 RepID=A0A9P6RUJ9_9FUNG|nr:hypothetical protein BGZ99_007293 [Dissophora globulifera]